MIVHFFLFFASLSVMLSLAVNAATVSGSLLICFVLFFQPQIQLFESHAADTTHRWLIGAQGSSSMIDTDKTAWLTLRLGCPTHISVSSRMIEIMLKQPSDFSRDFQTKSYNTSISNVQDICICFYTLATHWGSINTDGLESVQFPKVRHKAQ